MCPTYTFIDKNTGVETSDFMTISAMEKHLEDNPHIQLGISAPALVSGVSMGRSGKPDRGFNDVLKKIKKNHRRSTINIHGSSSF